MSQEKLLENLPRPKHIAIIMDGNGRWAQEKGKDRIQGHRHGVKSVREVVEGCSELKIGYLTLYAFSTENWNRPKAEVDALMSLLVSTIRDEVEELKKNHVRLMVIGAVQDLPLSCQRELDEAMYLTKEETGLKLVLALSYSARWEILKAVQDIAKEVEEGHLQPSEIDSKTFESHLCTKDIPDPELMIRTGGERRISNFLLYQIAYSELYFTNKHWPDFRKPDLIEAIRNFQHRERRFGKTSEQIKKSKFK